MVVLELVEEEDGWMEDGRKAGSRVGNAGLILLARFWVLCAAVHTLRSGRAWAWAGAKVKVKVACFSHLAPLSVVSELGIAWKWGESRIHCIQ